MSWLRRVFTHPLPDLIGALAVAAVFAAGVTSIVLAQTSGSFPIPCQEAGIADPQACAEYMDQFLVPTPEPVEPEPFPSLQLPDACVQKGITDADACKRYLESLNAAADLPEPCRLEGITTIDACKAYMEKLSAPPPTEAEPPPSLPEACVKAGITAAETCKLYLEKLSGTSTPISLPDACVKAGVTTAEGCKAYMEKLSAPPPVPPEADACAARCAAAKEECYVRANGVASEMDICSAAAGACYQACAGTNASADACIKERCHAVTKDCMARTGDSAEALAACEKLIGACAAGCVKGPGQAFSGSECAKYACGLVEGRCMAGDAGSFSEESIAAAGGRIARCVQAGNDCRTRCAGGQVAATSPDAQAWPEPCRLKGLTDPTSCRKYMESLFKGSFDARESRFEAVSFEDEFDPASFLPEPCLEQGVKEPEACAELMRQSVVARMPKECQEAKIAEPDACAELFAKKAILPECREKGAKSPEECEAIIVARNLPKDCVEAKAFDKESCRKIVEDAYLPKACREAGAKDERACEKIIFDKYGRPEECAGLDDLSCRRLIEAGKIEDDILEEIEANELPEKCVAAGAETFEECDRLTRERTMPAECREAGIFSPDGCEKHLFEKYKKIGEEQLRAELPVECREAGVEEPGACRKLMEAKFFPKECVEAGVTDPDGCKKLLVARHMPKECRDQGLETREECEAYMREKHMAPICEAQGLTDPDACQEFVYSKLAEAVTCRNLGDAECALAVKGRHLGRVLDAKDAIGKIGERIRGSRNERGTIDPGAEGLREILPFETGRRLLALDSQAQVALTEDDEIETVAPVVLAYDADADGIPDDIEERHGLDPASPDGVEDLPDDLAPVERAILAGAALGQPLLEGEADEALAVEGVETVEEALVLSGEAPAGEVVTLYVYSPLPVVVTVTTGADGRWSYDFSDALKDGEHRTYVAVNDATGKVVKKSGPLSFFVREARAASPEAFVAADAARPDVDVEEASASRAPIRRFALGAAAAVAVAGALAFVLLRRKKPDLPQ